MEKMEFLDRARNLAKPFRVQDGEGFRLKDYDPGETLHLDKEDKPRAKEALSMGVDMLAHYQDLLYAQDRWGLLLIFQAMDAAGKDGTIKHVMSGVNPQGCQVTSFKAPSSVDLDHDFLCEAIMPYRKGAVSASSIGATTKKRSWFGFTPRCLPGRPFPSITWAKTSGKSALATSDTTKDTSPTMESLSENFS